MSPQTSTAAIAFTSRIVSIDATNLLILPAEASAQLPSRGQVSVEGSINGHAICSVLEPDGRRGHWLRLEPDAQAAIGLRAGDTVEVVVAPTKQWPEPEVPDDLGAALAHAPSSIRDVWDDITPMARWEWVRWVDATANPATRQRRVEVTISKIEHGKRRPCCFDLSACTDPAVARNAKLRSDIVG